MDVRRYFESLALEMASLKQRVRYLIDDAHWQTDGEWKESVVRHILRRHLPMTASVGRGFVVTGHSVSHQVDVLIYDATKPVLFRDGDLVFITPDAVFGIVEVKSRLTRTAFKQALGKLSQDIEIVRRHPNIRALAAIFAFEDDGGNTAGYLQDLKDSCLNYNQCVDLVAMGIDRFIRYWNLTPELPRRNNSRWHGYRMNNLAPGYFIHNMIEAVSPDSVPHNNEVWFPDLSKEAHLENRIQARWAPASDE